jgi:hypothetical protein
VWHGRVDPGFGDAPIIGNSVTWGENVHVRADGTPQPGVRLEGYDLSVQQPVDQSRIRSVPSGPNRGYQFVDQHTIRLNRGYRVNVYLTRENGDRDIFHFGRWENRWNALLSQGWGNPNEALQNTIRHETYGSSGRIGHQQGLEEAVRGDVCGNVALRLDRVAGSGTRVTQELERLRDYVFEFLHVATSHARVHSHHPSSGSPTVVRHAPPDATPYPAMITDSLRPLGAQIRFRHVCEYERLGI